MTVSFIFAFSFLFWYHFVMKKDIHPKYFEKATITCSCGAKFIVGSTIENMEVEICSQCHPLYTGQKKLVDTAGRVQKFEERLEKAKKMQAEKPKPNPKPKKEVKAKKEVTKDGRKVGKKKK